MGGSDRYVESSRHGMAVITDVGNIQDIHPRNKQAVGKRLALWALAKDYGKKDHIFGSVGLFPYTNR